MESPRLDFFITGIFFSSLNCAIRTASGIAPGGETAPPGRMPIEQKAIAMRMQNMRLSLLDDTTFEVVVDNEIIAKDFTALIPNIQAYLRGSLKNRKVTMTVRVSEATENVRAVSRVEKFQMMAQKNSALLQLKEEFGLELY